MMLKWWRISFDPAQDYFQYRHLWVLLPGLPLNFWNVESSDAIEMHLVISSMSMTSLFVHWTERWEGFWWRLTSIRACWRLWTYSGETNYTVKGWTTWAYLSVYILSQDRTSEKFMSGLRGGGGVEKHSTQEGA
jgi:hypothetical protein